MKYVYTHRKISAKVMIGEKISESVCLQFNLNQPPSFCSSYLLSSSLNLTMPLSFILNQKGGQNLVDEAGYRYRIRLRVPKTNTSYWMCVEKYKSACPATITTMTSTNSLISQDGEHSHSNRLVENRVKDMVSLISLADAWYGSEPE